MRVNVEGDPAAAGGLPGRGPGPAPLRAGRLARRHRPLAPTRCDEAAPFGPAEPYGASKAEAERITLSYAGRLPVTVARPPRIMGPGDRENLLFFQIARRGLALGFGGPPRPLSWIDVDDCARGFLLLAERPEAVGQAFFLASPEPTSTQGLMLEAARALGVAAAPASTVPAGPAPRRWRARPTP